MNWSWGSYAVIPPSCAALRGPGWRKGLRRPGGGPPLPGLHSTLTPLSRGCRRVLVPSLVGSSQLVLLLEGRSVQAQAGTPSVLGALDRAPDACLRAVCQRERTEATLPVRAPALSPMGACHSQACLATPGCDSHSVWSCAVGWSAASSSVPRPFGRVARIPRLPNVMLAAQAGGLC